jgi:chromosome segregation ATPase
MVIELTALEKVAIEYLGKLTEQLHDLKKELDDDAHDFRMEMRDLHKGTNNKIEEIGRKVESMNNELTAVKTKVELYQKAEETATDNVWKKIKGTARFGLILIFCAFIVGSIAPEIYKTFATLVMKFRSYLK